MRGFRMMHGLGWTAAVAAMGIVGQTAGAATLINHYTFDNTLNDSGPHGDHATQGGADASVYAAGRSGQAITFNGTDDFLSIAAQRFTDDFTMSMFIKPADLGENTSGGGQIQMLAANSATSANTPGFRWHINSFNRGDRRIRLETSNGTPTTGYELARTGINVVTEAEWQHVAMRINRDGGLAEFFLDGVELTLAAADDDVVPDFSLNPNSFWRLGATTNTTGSFHFNGLMDDVRLYDGALTDGEIVALAAVPEPATAGLCLAAAGVLLATRRRGV